MEDIDVVKKVLRPIPNKFDSKIFAIQEAKDINKYTMDDIHGALVAYKMRKDGKQESTNKEAAFKAKKKSKKTLSKLEDLEGLEAHFSRMLRKGLGK